MQRCRIKTAGKSPSAGRNNKVVGSRQSRNTVQKDHHVASMLYKTSRALDHHLRNAFVALRELVEGGIDDFHVRSHNGFLDICDFLRTLVNQEDDHMHVRIVCRHGFCHLF